MATFSYTNAGSAPRLLNVEPWAHTYDIAPGATVNIEMAGDDAYINVETDDDGTISVSLDTGRVVITLGDRQDEFGGFDDA